MQSKLAAIVLTIVGFTLFGANVALAQATFSGITGPPGTVDINPVSVSSNGATVVGATNLGAFKWDPTNGLIQLGAPAGLTSAAANDVSDDGNTVVGLSLDPASFDEEVPFRWTPGTGSVRLNATDAGLGNTVSADGSIIAGQVFFGTGDEAYRWDSGTGIVGKGQPAGGNSSNFHQVTSDGTLFVGTAIDSSGDEIAIRWDATNGFETLNGVGTFEPREALGVSNNGDVAVGIGGTAGSTLFEAFVWDPVNEGTGLGFLGGPVGSEESLAFDVSADGSTVVGASTVGATPGVFEAIIWDSTAGMRSLQSELNSLGAGIPAGWTLEFAIGVSSDGNTIIGGGNNPSGNFQGWVATLPEPSTHLGFGLGALLLSRLAPARKRGRKTA